MNGAQIAVAINNLIMARDGGADVQTVIDDLFAKWESINAVALAAPHPDHIAHAAIVGMLN